MSAREMLRDLALYLLFVSCVTVMTTYHTDINNAYRQTRAVDAILFNANINDEYGGESILDEITTVDDMWDFFHKQFVPFLVKKRTPLDTFNFNVIGTARVRQVRSKPPEDKCAGIDPGMRKLYSLDLCTEHLWHGEVETRHYNSSWDQLLVLDDDNDDAMEDVDEDKEIYFYKTAKELKTTAIAAPRYSYPGGGYVLTVPREDERETMNLVKHLEDWLDQHTRCIFLELTIYNADANLFSLVLIGFEFDINGGPFPFKQISTSRLYHYEEKYKKITKVAETIVAVCSGLYVLILAKNYLMKGPKKFFTSFWNWVDIFILFSVGFVAVCINLRDATLVSKLNIFNKYGNNRFLDFQAVFQREMVVVLAEGLLGALVFIKLIYVLRFNPFSKTFMKSMDVAKEDVAGYTVMAVLCMMSFCVSGFILFGDKMFNYVSFDRCLLGVVFFILGEAEYDDLVETNRILGPVYFVMMIFATQYVILNFFIAMIKDGFDMARSIEFGKEDASIKYMVDTISLYLGLGGGNRRQK